MGDSALQSPSRRRLTRWLVAGLLLGGAGVGVYFLFPRVQAQYHWRQAQNALDQNDFTAARAHLKRCLEAWPESGETHFLMARTCRRAGDLDTARAELQEARRLHWDPKDLELEILLTQAQSGIVRPVEQTLGDYVAVRHRDEKLILEALIVGCLRSNFLPEAFGWANLWSDHFPEDWQPSYWRGRALQLGLRTEPAIEAFQQVLAKNPDYPEAHQGLAEVLLEKGQLAEALPHYQAFLRKVPDDAGALYGLARCQYALGPSEAVRDTLERLLTQYPDHPGGLMLRGRLERDANKPEEAVEWFRRSVAAAPYDLEANQILANTLRRLERTDEAQTYEKKVEKIGRDLHRLQDLQKDILLHPKEVEPRYQAGTLCLGLGQEDQGMRWLVSALLLDPTHSKTKKALMENLQKMGDPRLIDSYRPILEAGGGMGK